MATRTTKHRTGQDGEDPAALPLGLTPDTDPTGADPVSTDLSGVDPTSGDPANASPTGDASVSAATALAASGVAVAVMPCGLDQFPPDPQRRLLEWLAADGLLLSAWPPGARPNLERMRANQRLLAALGVGTVLVEAVRRSNPLHAVVHALDLGRVGMVVLGPVTSTMSAACHQLLRADPRARLVTGVADVIAELPHRMEPKGRPGEGSAEDGNT